MEKPKWAYYHQERWDRIVLHYNFVKKIEDEHGMLWCEYCGKDKLKLYPWNEKPNRDNMATVDHFLPKSKYPDLANEETNFIIACSTCNEKKKDDIWADDTIQHSRLNKINK